MPPARPRYPRGSGLGLHRSCQRPGSENTVGPHLHGVDAFVAEQGVRKGSLSGLPDRPRLHGSPGRTPSRWTRPVTVSAVRGYPDAPHMTIPPGGILIGTRGAPPAGSTSPPKASRGSRRRAAGRCGPRRGDRAAGDLRRGSGVRRGTATMRGLRPRRRRCRTVPGAGLGGRARRTGWRAPAGPTGKSPPSCMSASRPSSSTSGTSSASSASGPVKTSSPGSAPRRLPWKKPRVVTRGGP